MSIRTCAITLAFICAYATFSLGIGVGSAINTADRVYVANALLAESPEEFAHFMGKIADAQKGLVIISAIGSACSAGLALWFLTTVKKKGPCVTWDRDGRVRNAGVITGQSLLSSERSMLLSGYVGVKSGERSLTGRKGLRRNGGFLMVAACIYALVTSVRARRRQVQYQLHAAHAHKIYKLLRDAAVKAEGDSQDWVLVAAAIKKAEAVGCVAQMSTTLMGLLMLGKILTMDVLRKNQWKKDGAAVAALLFTLCGGYLIKPLVTAGMRARAGVPDIDELFAGVSRAGRDASLRGYS